ncbi:MAG TPA: TonB-dependent receptor [Vicinamibacterales bacterium]|nr:TonB-dependent receptor [Vicinamibacterales bacterium]
MRIRIFLTVMIGSLLLAAGPALAQVNTATVNGTVADESRAVLPGVSITATDKETGRKYVATTDDKGAFQLALLPPGVYELQAELEGFAPADIPRMELLVGQNATVQFTMKISSVRESVTVTAEAPLIDITSTQVAGNVDRRQMEAMPLQGRNWLELSMLVKGVTTNNMTNNPGISQNESFNLNLDGQQIKSNDLSSGSGEPHFSREAIAEFQIVTNQFDVTQGRSTGVQVQAVSKSGTNLYSGVGYGYFRSDKFNAADPVAGTVLPYQDQQSGFALGGPIIKDVLHFFFTYEHENNPATVFDQPPQLGNQTLSFASPTTQNSFLARGDWHASPQSSVSLRAAHWTSYNPFSLSSSAYPSLATISEPSSTSVAATWSQVAGNNHVGEFLVGYNRFLSSSLPQPSVFGQPEYDFPGATMGAPFNYPSIEGTRAYQLRYSHTWTRPKHEIKYGGEFVYEHDTGTAYYSAFGRMTFTSLPPPAQMAARFPITAWNNPAAWNLTGLDSITQQFVLNYDPGRNGLPSWQYDIPRPIVALWIGDTWRAAPNLTLNYGLRWDDDWGAANPPYVNENTILINNGVQNGDFGFKTGTHDNRDFGPRGGFSYNVGGGNSLIVRGGSGLYFATPVSNVTYSQQLYNRFTFVTFYNTGQPGFVTNPTGGVTQSDILAGKVALPPQTTRILSPDFKMPFTWQSSVGFEKELGPAMAISSDLVGYRWYRDTRSYDPNLFYDPTTGYNINPTVRVPNPQYGQISYFVSDGTRDYMALTNGFTRRFKNHFQGGVTYTLMFFMNDNGSIGYSNSGANNEFNRLDGEWARSTDFQRNTVRLWAMYQLPYGLSLSGAYFYGSGNYFADTVSGDPYGKPGTNRLNLGAPITIPASLLNRWDGPAVIATGAIAPRNALQGTPLHKIDLRVQEELKPAGRLRVQLIGEVFNIFNHDNFGSFVTLINNASFGQPRQNLGNAYVPRSGQLGIRVSY